MSVSRNTRACMVCSIVREAKDFRRQGCPNCEPILQLQGSDESVEECTSQVFEGLITLADPKGSWVAKWQRLSAYVPGVYAIKVVGQLPDDVIDALQANGIKYIPRDGTAADDDVAA